MKNENDIEDLFKKSFDNYEPEVRPKVWENVKVGLKWGSLGMLINALINKIGTTTLIAVVSSVAAIIGTMAVVNMNNDKKLETADKAAATTVIIADTNEQSNTTNEPAAAIENKEEMTITASATKENTKETAIVKNSFIDESVASISASLVNGTAPLIVDLSNAGTGKTNKWLFSDSKKTITANNNVYIFESPGTYTIELTSKNTDGKTDVDTLSVEVTGNAPVANFSPNGDGASDVFLLQSKNITTMNVKIFDKGGIVVYNSEGTASANWDGKNLQGKEVKEGAYFYSIQATDVNGKKKDQRGIVNLKR